MASLTLRPSARGGGATARPQKPARPESPGGDWRRFSFPPLRASSRTKRKTAPTLRVSRPAGHRSPPFRRDTELHRMPDAAICQLEFGRTASFKPFPCGSVSGEARFRVRRRREAPQGLGRGPGGGRGTCSPGRRTAAPQAVADGPAPSRLPCSREALRYGGLI